MKKSVLITAACVAVAVAVAVRFAAVRGNDVSNDSGDRSRHADQGKSTATQRVNSTWNAGGGRLAPPPLERLPNEREPIADGDRSDIGVENVAEMPLPDVGELDPFEAIKLTKAEYSSLMELVNTGMRRQREIDRREQNGEITTEQHAKLSDALSEEMDERIDEILGPERADIFAEVTATWAKKAVPRVLGTEQDSGPVTRPIE